MNSFPKLLLFTPTIFFFFPLANASASPFAKDKFFFEEKREIIILAKERVRSAPADYQKVVKMGETRLRQMHDSYKLQRSTPPTLLDADVQELKNKTQEIRVLHYRRRSIPPDPEAAALIDRYAERYSLAFDGLLAEAEDRKKAGAPEGRAYWDLMGRFEKLRNQTELDLMGNAAHSKGSVGKSYEQDEWRLLKALEFSARRTKRPVSCVVAPGEVPHLTVVDPGPFYQSQGLLPTLRPRKTGSFAVPVGCRSVTRRESGVNIIYRVSDGKAAAFIGSQEKDLDYGYLLIPPDVEYYFENLSDRPLKLEYIALPSS